MKILGYINFSVLALLFCLMLIIAGFKKNGVFTRISNRLTKLTTNIRILSIILIMTCFVSSMLITNDVALITFVPLTLEILGSINPISLIIVIVLETVAANLGGMLTPIGNPQNIYMYEHFEMNISKFMQAISPVVAISLAWILMLTLLIKKGKIEKPLINDDKKKDSSKDVNESKDATATSALPSNKTEKAPAFLHTNIIYTALFILCILTVLRVLPYVACFIVVLITVFICYKSLCKKVDYKLLITFIIFFLISGFIGDTKSLSRYIKKHISGHEVSTSVLLSQVISNVPATILLSKFTSSGYLLLAGIHIGGLGTIIASMASLISFRLYAKEKNAHKWMYLGIFTLINLVMLLVLLIYY